MSDSGFGRPGNPARPTPEHWPYHVPTPEESTPDVFHDSPPAPEPEPGRSPHRGARLLLAVGISVVTGAILGGVWVSGVVREPAVPSPIPVTVGTFPRDLLGAQRNDVELRDAGFGPTVERLDAEFEEQLAGFRFAYGGDGATLGYGRLFNLTILNGILTPPLPRDGSVGGDGYPPRSRRLVSLRSADVACTFEPDIHVDTETGFTDLGSLDDEGRTDCVLVDADRHLSLRIANTNVERGVDALDTATLFRDELLRIHASLID